MKRICAWCLKDMGDIAPEQPGVTHGICEECKAKIMAEKDGHNHTGGGGVSSSFNRSPSISRG